jgi:2,3-bisphosphoglycerate-dependent phosphoglycerate mutase
VELLLIRHARPVRIDGGDGPADPHLAEEGLEQAQRLADWWAPHGIDAIWSSPMQRARQTAEPLARATGLEMATDPGLQEFDAHLSFYVPIEELANDPEALRRVMAEWLSPEAEQERQSFRELVVRTFDAIVAQHQGGRVAVVCHGGVINAYLSHLISLESTMWFEPAYTSVSRALAGDHKQLVSVNETPHLATLPLPTRFG